MIPYNVNTTLLVEGPQAYESGGRSPPDSGKPIIFQAKATFFRQKQTAKNENFLYL